MRIQAFILILLAGSALARSLRKPRSIGIRSCEGLLDIYERPHENSLRELFQRSNTQMADSFYESFYKKITDSTHPVEIVMLLDASSVMGETNFKAGKEFLANLTNIIPRQHFLNNHLMTTLLTYSASRNITSVLRPGYIYSHYRKMVGRVINSAQYHDDEYSDGVNGLIWAMSRFTNNTDSQKILIMVSNGHFTDNYMCPTNIVSVSKILHQTKVDTYSIGVGDQVNEAALSMIASNPDEGHVLQISNDCDAREIIQRIRRQIKGHRPL